MFKDDENEDQEVDEDADEAVFKDDEDEDEAVFKDDLVRRGVNS